MPLDGQKNNALVVPTTAPLALSENLPDYLRDTKNVAGLEGFGKEDFKIPEIKLLQGLNPEVNTYKGVAIPGEYFHTGLMKSLGPKFRSVVCVARKRVVVWRPKSDQGGGILALSDDSINWKTGANREFSVTLKGAKKPVIWKTGPNVKASGLLEFGTSNPEIENSAPAAIQYYEYIHYLPDWADASPVVQRLKSTALDNARKLNSYFLLKQKPIYVHALEWSVEDKKNNDGEWTIPKFQPIGYVDEVTANITRMMNEQYSEIDLGIVQEDDNDGKVANSEAF